MPHRIIRDASDLNVVCTLLSNLKFPITVNWTQGIDRSLEQNALQFKWAIEASTQRGDMEPEEVRCEWKLHYGVPIMRAENESFRLDYDETVKGLPYHLKLRLMRRYAVTSEMNVKQMTAYLNTVQRECAEQGIILTDPETRNERRAA